MHLPHLDTLLAIVDEGSFDAAADVLGVSPSAVSQRVKAMERTAGRVLLRRGTPVGVTEAGEVLLQAARRMALLEAETDLALRERIDRIPISVAINTDSVESWFQPVLAEVASFGDVALRLRVEDESHTLSLLRRGDVLGAVTTAAAPVSGCQSHPLGTMRYLACAQPDLVARFATAEGMDWARMPVLRFGATDWLQDADLDGRLPASVRRRRPVSHVPSPGAFVTAVRVGLGWALLPEMQARPLLRSGELIQLDDLVREVPLYWQRWRLDSPTLRRLTDAVLSAAGVLRAD